MARRSGRCAHDSGYLRNVAKTHNEQIDKRLDVQREKQPEARNRYAEVISHQNDPDRAKQAQLQRPRNRYAELIAYQNDPDRKKDLAKELERNSTARTGAVRRRALTAPIRRNGGPEPPRPARPSGRLRRRPRLGG